MMARRLLILTLIIIGMTIISCSLTKATHEDTPSPYPSTTEFLPEVILSPSPDPTSSGPKVDTSSWIFDGPIYETHPYYHGETFDSLTEAIPDIANLGIRTLYLMPIWEQPQGFPTAMEQHVRGVYRVPDFSKIDPVYGTPQDLKRLVATAHEYGLKVLFDLIPNNTPPGSVIWSNGWVHTINLPALQGLAQTEGVRLEYSTARDGDYVSYGCLRRQERFLCEIAGLMDGSEVKLLHFPEAGWGFAPDYTNAELIDYFTNVAEHHVRVYDIDGWRIDAPTNNWNPRVISNDHSIVKLLNSVKETINDIKPEAILLCETSQIARASGSSPVLDEVCDVSYSTHFYLKIIQEEAYTESSQKLIDILDEEQIWYDTTRARFLETHGGPRITVVSPGLERPLLVLIATVPGIPMIQAGQEVGATAQYGPDLSKDWNLENDELAGFYRKVFEIRRRSDALKYGSIENVWRSGDPIYAYLRNYQDENAFVLINFNRRTANSILTIGFGSETVLYDVLNEETFKVEDPDNFHVSVPGISARILVVQSD